jgi:1,4-alpha-glucan branching enzyme
MTYAFSENYILPLSHDEVVYEKKSLIEKMPGSYDDKFANVRTFFGFMMGHPGKKLSFMGNEIAQFAEWDYKSQINWQLLDYERHRQMQTYVRDLNRFYLENSPLWNNDGDWNGFRWISPDDRDNSVVAFRRIDRRGRELIVVCNFCPVERQNYRIGLPRAGIYEAVFQSDAEQYGGRGTPLPTVAAEKIPMHGLPFSGSLTLAPLLWKYLGWLPRFLELFAESRRTRCVLPHVAVPCRIYQSARDEMVSTRSLVDLQSNSLLEISVLPESGHFGYHGADLQKLQADFASLFQ